MLNHKHRFLPNKTSKACLDIIRPTFHVPLVCPNQQSKVFSPSLRLETKLICRFLCVAHFCSFPKQKRKFESQSQSVTQGTPSFPLHSKRKNNSLLEHFTLIEQKLGIQQVLFQLQSISQPIFFLLPLFPPSLRSLLLISFFPFNEFSPFVVQAEEWFGVTLSEAHEMGLTRKVKNTQQLMQLLEQKYPGHKWERMAIMRGRFGQQHRLEQAISILFPVHIPSSPSSPFCSLL